MNDSDSIEFHRADEWTAVYLNGTLERVGDNYLANEWLQDYVGVRVVTDDAFMRGGDDRDSVAQTLDQVHAYTTHRDRLLEKAEEFEREAAALREQAKALKARATSSHENEPVPAPVSGLTPGGSCRG